MMGGEGWRVVWWGPWRATIEGEGNLVVEQRAREGLGGWEGLGREWVGAGPGGVSLRGGPGV